MVKMWLMPYRMASESAIALSNSLDIRRVNKERTALKGNRNKTLVNWGNTSLTNEELLKCRILNHPDTVNRVVNKLSFFRNFDTEERQRIIPEYTTELDTAISWMSENENTTVVARALLTASSGRGIILMKMDNPDGWIRAPLYTKYKPKRDEFRVHFFRGKGITFRQRKGLAQGIENPNWKIRNYDNGFRFLNQNIELPQAVTDAAEYFINEMDSLGLDFGALDIIWNERENRAYILEVNTAPGLEGSTLESYSENLKEYLT